MTTADRRDPLATVEAAVVLLERGRPDMARRLLADLPEAFRAALAEAYSLGQADGLRAAKRATSPPRPAPPAGGSRSTSGASPGRPGFRREASEVRRAVEILGKREWPRC